MMTKRTTLGGGALIALALLFIGLTVLSTYLLRGWRLDLTQNRLYTLAPGTQNILRNLKEPLNVYFFFTEEAASPYPSVKNYGMRVREFLQELAARSNGKLRLNIINPQPFSEEEDRASELGVRPMPSGTAGGPPLYFGMAITNSTDGREAIGFFDPSKEEFLEYDVVKLINQLSNPKKPVIGWLSGIPMTPVFDPSTGQQGSQPIVFTQAQQLFDVRMLDAQNLKIDEDIDVVVLVHPKELSLATQFALDQYALRGGHLAVFVDPVAEKDPAGMQEQNMYMAQGQMYNPQNADKSSHLERLLTAWGVEFDTNQVVGDLSLALQVGMRPGAAPERHLAILGFDKESFNTKDVVTAGLSTVNVATAGILKPIKSTKSDKGKGVDVKFEPLMQTSTNAGLLPKEQLQMMFDPSMLMNGFRPTGQRYAIAARVTGKVKTAFPGGPPTGVTLPAGEKALTASTKPLNLVVVADTDLLADMLWVRGQSFFGQTMYQTFANNGDLVFNAIDNLAGSNDLISVRGRATYTRPFKVVEDIRTAAESRFRDKEQELQAQLQETDRKLTQLESQRNDQSANFILTPEQERELDRFQEEKVRIRKELRAVRAGLDQDIRNLGGMLKFVNIVLVPVLFAVLALLFAAWRRKRQRAQAAALRAALARPVTPDGASAAPPLRLASEHKVPETLHTGDEP